MTILFDGCYFIVNAGVSDYRSDWCSDNIGMFDWKVGSNPVDGCSCYFFKNDEDAILFKLSCL